MSASTWAYSQLGAREHDVVLRMLCNLDFLSVLFTD